MRADYPKADRQKKVKFLGGDTTPVASTCGYWFTTTSTWANPSRMPGPSASFHPVAIAVTPETKVSPA